MKPRSVARAAAFVLLVVLSAFDARAGTRVSRHQGGYEIRLTMRPYQKQRVYLGHYFGYEFPIIDSATLDGQSHGAFRGKKPLPQGMYIVFDPDRRGVFDMVVDSIQRFDVSIDLSNPLEASPVFTGSRQSAVFNDYLRFFVRQNMVYATAVDQLSGPLTRTDSLFWTRRKEGVEDTLAAYREEVIRSHPNDLVSVYFRGMREPRLPRSLLQPVDAADSAARRSILKAHWWDNIDLSDGRLAYSQFLGQKLDRYFHDAVELREDSAIAHIDRLMVGAAGSSVMTQFLLSRLVNGSMRHMYKWGDTVLIHLFRRYIENRNYSWLSRETRAAVAERAYFLMGNMIGTPAPDITLPGPDGRSVSLHGANASYTVVCFWDPRCGHCLETLPSVDSAYRAAWKEHGIDVFAVASESDGTVSDWLKDVEEYTIQDWRNVYCSQAEERQRNSAGLTTYAQLYDVWYYPSFFLLDKENRFIAKKLDFHELLKVLEPILEEHPSSR